MICSLEKFLPSPLRTGNSLILIWLKMRRGHFKHCQNLVHSQNKKMYGDDKHQGCKGIVDRNSATVKRGVPTVNISKLTGTKIGNKKYRFNSSGVVPPWQTDAEVDVGTIFMFETATIPATGTLFFLQLKLSSKSSSLLSKTTQVPLSIVSNHQYKQCPK